MGVYVIKDNQQTGPFKDSDVHRASLMIALRQ